MYLKWELKWANIIGAFLSKGKNKITWIDGYILLTCDKRQGVGRGECFYWSREWEQAVWSCNHRSFPGNRFLNPVLCSHWTSGLPSRMKYNSLQSWGERKVSAFTAWAAGTLSLTSWKRRGADCQALGILHFLGLHDWERCEESLCFSPLKARRTTRKELLDLETTQMK